MNRWRMKLYVLRLMRFLSDQMYYRKQFDTVGSNVPPAYYFEYEMVMWWDVLFLIGELCKKTKANGREYRNISNPCMRL